MDSNEILFSRSLSLAGASGWGRLKVKERKERKNTSQHTTMEKKTGERYAGIVIEILVGTYEQVVVGYRQPSQPNKYINK
jgi:hypothetical protein